MPVLIFAASEDLDLIFPLASRLRKDGSEVRCYLDDDAYELRNIGCKIAVGRLDDEPNLEGALTNVHTFVPFLPDPVNVRNPAAAKEFTRIAEAVAGAGEGSRVPQTIVTLPALDETHGPLGSVYSSAAESFVNRLKPVCLIRTGFLWGPNRPFVKMISALGDEVSSESTVSVTNVEDLAELIAAADDREEIDGTWDFSSPALRLQELIAQAAGTTQGIAAPHWMLEVLQGGFAVGSNATEELGVEAKPLPS